jgi:hypothetical protein
MNFFSVKALKDSDPWTIVLPVLGFNSKTESLTLRLRVGVVFDLYVDHILGYVFYFTSNFSFLTQSIFWIF